MAVSSSGTAELLAFQRRQAVMSPIDALSEAVLGAIVSSRAMRPGVVVEHLPRETREALQKLTSDDLASMRVDWCIGKQ